MSAAAIIEILSREAGVEAGRMFGSDGLKVGGRVFAMEVRGRLVLKLPAARVQALCAAGAGTPFDPGHGRLMKQWVALLASGDPGELSALAQEALAFVRESL